MAAPLLDRNAMALQFMLAMARDTALSPQAIATRAFELVDAFASERVAALGIGVQEITTKAYPRNPGKYPLAAPPPAKPGDEIPF